MTKHGKQLLTSLTRSEPAVRAEAQRSKDMAVREPAHTRADGLAPNRLALPYVFVIVVVQHDAELVHVWGTGARTPAAGKHGRE